jgi:hypothetical protein
MVVAILCGFVTFNVRGWLDRETARQWEWRGRRGTLVMRSEAVIRARIRLITAVGLAFGSMVVIAEVVAIATGRVG